MAMTVLNNTAAALTIGELNKNISSLNRQHKKVSSGMKLNSAGDDASAYAISERMRAQIRSLDQDMENVKNGRALLKVAAGGIDNIIDELRNIKELAINSANDTNTDKDRVTLQKEYEHKVANINDIVSETNYNGKILLDGRYGRKLGASSGGANGGGGVGNVSQTEPTGTPIMITAGNYTISADGVYMLASGYSGTVTIASGVQNVKIQQQTPGTALNEAFIVGPASGNANLWIEDLNIENQSTDANIIKFQGSNNYLTTKGRNILFRNDNSSGGRNLRSAVINVGGGLTLDGANGSSLNVIMDTGATSLGMISTSGAGIGTDYYENSTASIYLNSGNVNVAMKYGPVGAGIGSGDGGSIGNIIISGGIINVQVENVRPTWRTVGACIGSGRFGTAGDITIDNAAVSVTAHDGAGIGSGGTNGNVGNINIGNNAVINATSIGGAGIGSGYGGPRLFRQPSSAGDITISRRASITSFSNEGDNIGAGYCSTVGTITYVDDWAIDNNPSANNFNRYSGNPLVIHHGTKANQALNCYINDMDTDAMGLSNTKISTRDDAIQALSDDTTGRIGAIDAAIEYALGEATNVGAYISRLEHTEENLVTANENTQASESTIRDADMAKEMAEYTKYSLLTQSSQAMLAQANQNGSQVLSLLQ